MCKKYHTNALISNSNLIGSQAHISLVLLIAFLQLSVRLHIPSLQLSGLPRWIDNGFDPLCQAKVNQLQIIYVTEVTTQKDCDLNESKL